jgi:hypothetical protein
MQWWHVCSASDWICGYLSYESMTSHVWRITTMNVVLLVKVWEDSTFCRTHPHKSPLCRSICCRAHTWVIDFHLLGIFLLDRSISAQIPVEWDQMVTHVSGCLHQCWDRRLGNKLNINESIRGGVHLWLSGYEVRPKIKGYHVRVPVVPDHFVSACLPVQLDWFIKDQLVCGLPVIHAPKRPLGMGSYIKSSFHFWPNHWASMAPNHSDRHNTQWRRRVSFIIIFTCLQSILFSDPSLLKEYGKNSSPCNELSCKMMASIYNFLFSIRVQEPPLSHCTVVLPPRLVCSRLQTPACIDLMSFSLGSRTIMTMGGQSLVVTWQCNSPIHFLFEGPVFVWVWFNPYVCCLSGDLTVLFILLWKWWMAL